jgi:hypothetical protein
VTRIVFAHALSGTRGTAISWRVAGPDVPLHRSVRRAWHSDDQAGYPKDMRVSSSGQSGNIPCPRDGRGLRVMRSGIGRS